MLGVNLLFAHSIILQEMYKQIRHVNVFSSKLLLFYSQKGFVHHNVMGYFLVYLKRAVFKSISRESCRWLSYVTRSRFGWQGLFVVYYAWDIQGLWYESHDRWCHTIWLTRVVCWLLFVIMCFISQTIISHNNTEGIVTKILNPLVHSLNYSGIRPGCFERHCDNKD